MLELPFFIHPIKVLILEDDIEFANIIKNVLRSRLIFPDVIYTYNDFIKYIKNNTFRSLDKIFSYVDEIEYEEHHLSFSLSEFNKLVDKYEIAKPLAIIILDHNMPEKKGLDILEELENGYLKKVLLTGTVNDTQALKAFNNKKIDAFIPKQSLDLDEKINIYINQLYFDYFIKLSHEYMPIHNIDTISNFIFKSKKFKNFFLKFLDENNIISYRTIGLKGIFKLTDDKDKNYIFSYINEDDYEFYIENGLSYKIDKKIINSVINKEQIPFCLINNKPYLVKESWFNSMKKINSIKIENTYFDFLYYKILD